MREKSLALKKQIEEKTVQVADAAKALAAKVNRIGSILSPIAPVSDNEDDNKELRVYGPKTTDPSFLTHVDLVRMIDGVEYNNGFFFNYFLKILILKLL